MGLCDSDDDADDGADSGCGGVSGDVDGGGAGGENAVVVVVADDSISLFIAIIGS